MELEPYAAASLRGRLVASRLRLSADRVEATAGVRWSGPAGSAFRHRVRAEASGLRTLAGRLEDACDDLDRLVDLLRRAAP